MIKVINLGLTDYAAAWDLQRAIFNLRVAGKMSDVLLLNEHHHVYTLGKSSEDAHLLANSDELNSTGAEVYNIDRGGDVTYHGPGQLVGYPILDLNNYYLDIHRYLRDLEEVIIRTVSEFGITATREDGLTGVWVGNNKLAAIGVKVSHWVTMHGFALNVNTDLSYFDRIIPCGIFHKGVTSLEQILGEEIPPGVVNGLLSKKFGEVFHTEMMECVAEDFLDSIGYNNIMDRTCLQAERQ